MLIIILVVILLIFLIWILMIYVRKSMWDTVHQNLLDLEDHFEGKVIRRNMLARPVFHGKLNDINFTLNFSSERTSNGRMNYIDVSYDLSTKCSITLASQQWLNDQNAEKQQDFQLIKSKKGQSFLIRPASKDEVKNLITQTSFSEFIDEFPDLGYFFSGKTGILCEYFSDNIARATKFENLKMRLELIEKLARTIH